VVSVPQSPADSDWRALFKDAFTQSRNPMALLDDQRRHVEVNGAYVSLLGYPVRELRGHPVYEFVVGGPQVTAEEWRQALRGGSFTGETEMRCANGHTVSVQWAANPEKVTGRRLVLFVALSTSRWGAHARRSLGAPLSKLPLTTRELEIVNLIALGRTGPEIADELRIAHDTVRSHARNAMLKSGARSRAHLVAKALGEGFVLGRARPHADHPSPAGAQPNAEPQPNGGSRN
jgi:PAS domain S-box-containing protein